MKKVVTISLFIFFTLIIGTLYLIHGTHAATLSDPLAKSFPLHGNVYDGWFSDVVVGITVNDAWGLVSSYHVTSQDATTNVVHPQAISMGKPISLQWKIDDPYIRDVDNCSVSVKNEDSGNNIANINAGFASSNAPFNVSSLPPGNYSFQLNCNLNNGRILSDVSYVYFLLASTDPSPESRNYAGGIDNTGKFRLTLFVSGSQGIASLSKLQPYEVLWSPVLEPIAFTQSQISAATGEISVYQIGSTLLHQLKECHYRGTTLYRDDLAFQPTGGSETTPIVTGDYLPIVNSKTFYLGALGPGTHHIDVECTTTNGYTISDYLNVYVLPNASRPSPTPTPAPKPQSPKLQPFVDLKIKVLR